MLYFYVSKIEAAKIVFFLTSEFIIDSSGQKSLKFQNGFLPNVCLKTSYTPHFTTKQPQ